MNIRVVDPITDPDQCLMDPGPNFMHILTHSSMFIACINIRVWDLDPVIGTSSDPDPYTIY